MALLGVPINGIKYNASTASRFMYGYTNGVYSAADDFKVTPAGGMSISISSGAGHMTPFPLLHINFSSGDPETLQLGLAPQFNPEFRRIIARWELTALGAHPYFMVLPGTPATNPQRPAITRSATTFDISVAAIRIPAGTLEITPEMIFDERLDESVCGIVSSSIKSIPTQALYDQWFNWFNGLQMDAESRSQAFIAWMDLFKSDNEASLSAWITAFQSENSSLFSDWYNSFKITSESDFREWFADLQNTLDDNQASNLFNKIDQHERLNIDGAEVHGIRAQDGYFQIMVDGEWVNLVLIPTGFTRGSFNARRFTRMTFNNRVYTVATFNAGR